MSEIRIKRIYEDYEEADGVRILVDRLWPRGVSKERARLDLWLKEVGPSHELRKWFGHEARKFAEFKDRYLLELSESPGQEALEKLRGLEEGRITLLTSARETTYNHVQVIKELLLEAK